MSSTPSPPVFTSLNYLFTQQAGRTVAHCLDLDLVTSGDSLEEAEVSLNAIVLQQIATCYVSGNFAELQFKAPSEYWERHEQATLLDTTRLEVEIPPVVIPVTKKYNIPITRAKFSAIAA